MRCIFLYLTNTPDGYIIYPEIPPRGIIMQRKKNNAVNAVIKPRSVRRRNIKTL